MELPYILEGDANVLEKHLLKPRKARRTAQWIRGNRCVESDYYR